MDDLVRFFQNYGVLISALAAVSTILGLFFTLYKASHDKEVAHLKNRIAELEKWNAELEKVGPEKIKVLEERANQLIIERDTALSANEALTADIERARAKQEAKEAALNDKIAKMFQANRTWLRTSTSRNRR